MFEKKLIITSIDIGRKNFGQYVEQVDANVLLQLSSKYKALPKTSQRRVKGKMNRDIKGILRKIYSSSKRLHMGVFDLCSSNERDPPYDMQTRRNIINHLENHRQYWEISDVIIIEQQYYNNFTPKGTTEANVKAIKVAEGVLMWFLSNYPGKEIEYFGSSFKTQMLGAPDGLTKPQRKRWAVIKATEILEKREDQKGLEYLKSLKKKDDVCDALIQCQAYKFRTLIGGF